MGGRKMERRHPPLDLFATNLFVNQEEPMTRNWWQKYEGYLPVPPFFLSHHALSERLPTPPNRWPQVSPKAETCGRKQCALQEARAQRGGEFVRYIPKI
jgi:hypothetical protein